MHPALRKGPLFCKTTPPIFHFFTKHPHFPLFLQNTPIFHFKNPYFHFFYKKHSPFHFLPTGLIISPQNALVLESIDHSDSKIC